MKTPTEANRALHLVTTNVTPTASDSEIIENTVQFMVRCWLAGLSFDDDGDTLNVGPFKFITDEIRDGVKKRKPIILRLMRSEIAEGIGCKVCGWRGRTYDGWCEHCFDLVIEAQARGMDLIKCSL